MGLHRRLRSRHSGPAKQLRAVRRPGDQRQLHRIGGSPLSSDIDGGCTTLLSPVFDLTGVETAFAKYWRWYAEAGAVVDLNQLIDFSSSPGQMSWATFVARL